MDDTPVTPPPVVQAKTRRRRRSWVLIILAAVMFAFVIFALPSYLWLTSQKGAEKISRFLTQRVVQSGNTRVSFGRVLFLRGWRVTLARVHVDYLVDKTWRPAMRSSKVVVDMGGLPFWGDLHLKVQAESLAVTLWQASDGHWAVPELGNGTKTPKDSLVTQRAVRLGLRGSEGSVSLMRRDGAYAWHADDMRVGLEYDSQHPGAPAGPRTSFALRSAGRDAWLRVDSLNARVPGVGRYAMRAEGWIGDVRQLRSLFVVGPHLQVRGSGALSPGADGDRLTLVGSVDSLSLLSPLAGFSLPDGGGTGRLTVTRRAGGTRARYAGTLRVEDARVDSLTLDVTQLRGGAWRIASASARLAGGTALRALTGDIDPARHRLAVRLLADIDTRHLPSAITRRIALPSGHTRGLAATLSGTWTGPLAIELRSGATEIQTYHLLGLHGTARYANGVVHLTHGDVQFPGALVHATGTINQKTLALSLPYTATITDLGAFADVFAVPGPLGGSGVAQGRVGGTVHHPVVTATGELRDGRFLELRGRTAHITEFVSDLSGRSPRVHVSLEVAGASFAGNTAPHAAASVDVIDGISSAAFRVRGYTADTLIVGHSRTVGPVTTVQIDTARVRLAGEYWHLAAPGLIFTAENGRTRFQPFQVIDTEGGRVFARRLTTGPGNAIAGAFVLENLRVATPPPATAEGVAWRGRLAGELEIAGALSDPDLVVHLAATTDSSSEGLAITDMGLWGRVARGTAVVDSLVVRAGAAGALHGAGRFTYAPGVPESLLARRWGALDKVRADARMWADSLDLAVWTAPLPQLTVPLGGIMTGGLTVVGSLATPGLALRTTIRGFSARDFVSDSLVAVGHWNTNGVRGTPDRGIALDSVVVFTSGQRTLLTGTIPASLHFPAAPTLGTSGLDLAVTADSLDMALLPALLPVLGDAAGTLSARLTLRGDPHAPEAAGEVHIREGLLRGFGRDEVVTHITGDATISGQGLQLTSLTGQEGEGRVSMAGAMHWGHGERTEYDFTVDARQLWVSQPGMFNGHITGIFHLTRDVDAPTPLTPHLSGNGHIDDARITWEFGQSSGGDLPLTGVYQVPTPAMTFDLRLRGDRNILLANRDASIDLSPDLQVSLNYDGIPEILGIITLNRGYYTFLDTRFTGVTGSVAFTAGPIDPTLDVTAHARIRDRTTPMDITLHLGGRQSESQVTLTSNNPVGVSEEEIVRAMTLGKVSSGTLTSSAGTFGENLLLRQFERSVLRETGLLDVFDVDNTSGAERISVGKYLLNELFVDYQQGLTTPTSNFSVEYWLTKTIRLTGSYARALPDATNSTTTTTQSGQTIRVGLKARKEF